MAMGSINRGRMTSKPPPGKKRVADWEGLRVRLVVPIKNGATALPVGLLATVEHAGSGQGLCLKSEPCPHCGVAVFIRKVLSTDVEVVEGGQP